MAEGLERKDAGTTKAEGGSMNGQRCGQCMTTHDPRVACYVIDAPPLELKKEFDTDRLARLMMGFPGDASDDSEGQKHDSGKPAMHLIPPNIELEIARVMQFGAEKYGPENWRMVPDLRNRYMGAAMRHVNAMRQGEALDEDSGLLHAAHAICCLMFIGETEMTAGPE